MTEQKYRLELDLAITDNEREEYFKLYAQMGIEVKILVEKGPAGGWPVGEVIGTKEALTQWVHKYYDSGDEGQNEYILEGIEPLQE